MNEANASLSGKWVGQATRLVAIVYVIVLLITGLPTAASAAVNTEDQEWKGHTYVSNQDCPFMHTTLTIFGGSPHFQTYGSLDYYGGGHDCGNTSALMYDYFVVRQDLYYWTGSQWVLCNAGPWYYNSPNPFNPSTGFNVVHSIQTSFSWSGAPCGIGYYTFESTAQYENPGWHGSWEVDQGYIYEAVR